MLITFWANHTIEKTYTKVSYPLCPTPSSTEFPLLLASIKENRKEKKIHVRWQSLELTWYSRTTAYIFLVPLYDIFLWMITDSHNYYYSAEKSSWDTSRKINVKTGFQVSLKNSLVIALLALVYQQCLRSRDERQAPIRPRKETKTH